MSDKEKHNINKRGHLQKNTGRGIQLLGPATAAQIAHNALVDEGLRLRAEEESLIAEIGIEQDNVTNAVNLNKQSFIALGKEAEKLGNKKFAKIIASGDIVAAQKMQDEINRLQANLNGFDASLNSLKDTTALSAEQSLFYILSLEKQANTLESEGKALGMSTEQLEANKNLREAFAAQFEDGAAGVAAYRTELERLIAVEATNQQKMSENKVAQINNTSELSGLRRQAAAEHLAEKAAEFERDAKQAALDTAINEAKKEGLTQTEAMQHKAVALAQQQFNESNASFHNLVKTQKDGFKVMQAASNAFENSLVSGLQGIFDGTMSVKDAFKNMAKSMVADIMKITIKMMALKMIESSMGFFADGGVAMGGPKATGGRGYATGGIPKGSSRGYQATLHGTEAVVPLPNGRSIPVEMKGGGGSGGDTNNVTINVTNTGAQGSQGPQSDSQSDDAQLGRVLQMAVTEELKKQKRPGGLLSPYGAS